MLDNLNQNEIELLYNFFQARGLDPTNEADILKFTTGDVTENVFVEEAKSEGIDEESAKELYKKIKASVPETARATEPLEFTDAEKEAKAKEIRTDKVEEEQVAELPVDKTLKPTEEIEEPAEPDVYQQVKDATPWAIGEDQKLTTEVRAPEAAYPESQKPSTEHTFGGDTFEYGKAPKIAEPDAPSPLDEPETGTVVPSALKRGSELAGVTQKSMQRRVGEKVPDAEEVQAKLYGKDAKNPFMGLKAGIPALMKAANDKTSTEDARNNAKGALALINMITSGDADEATLEALKRKVSEQTKKGFVEEQDEQQLNRLTKNLETLMERVATGDSGMPEDAKKNLAVQRFRAQTGIPGARKRYRQALSAIDRRKMTDLIVGGIGKAAAGLVGQYGFSRPTPVAEHFKYTPRNFDKEIEAAGGAYRAELKSVNDQIKSIDKLLAAGSKPEDISKMIQATAGAIKALVEKAKLQRGEYTTKGETTEDRVGSYRIFSDFAKMLNERDLKLKELENRLAVAKERAKAGPSTVVNMGDTTTTIGGKDATTRGLTDEQQAIYGDINKMLSNRLEREVLKENDPTIAKNKLWAIVKRAGINQGDFFDIIGGPTEWEPNPQKFMSQIGRVVFDLMRGISARDVKEAYQSQKTKRKIFGTKEQVERDARVKKSLDEVTGKAPTQSKPPAPKPQMTVPPETPKTEPADVPKKGDSYRARKFRGRVTGGRITEDGQLKLMWPGGSKIIPYDSPEAQEFMNTK